MLSVRVPEELRRRVRVAVASADSSMEAFVTFALERALTEPGSLGDHSRAAQRDVSDQDERPGSVSAAAVLKTGGEPVAAGPADGGEETAIVSESPPRSSRCQMDTPKGTKCKFCGKIH